MKFVIWGAGKQGRELLRRLNKDLVSAWIDTNHVGEIIDGIPVINYQTYCDSYYNCLIIVSPIYQDSIQSFLIEKNQLFMSYNDTPYELGKDRFFNSLIDYLLSVDESVILLYGISVYAIILYVELQRKGKTVEIISDCDGEEGRKIQEVLNDDFIIKQYQSDEAESKKIYSTVKIDYKDAIKVKMNLLNLYEIIRELHNTAIEKFRNIHKGKRCFIVATGPSLTVSDLNKLKELDQISFSMNKIFYAFDQTTWRPDYYMVSDPKITSMCRDEIKEIDCVAKFITDLDESFWSACNDENIFWIHEHRFMEGKERFSSDVSISFEFASTVTFLAIQLAVYMGFEKIYLLGTDHSGGNEVNAPERHFYGNLDTKSFYYKFDYESLGRLENDYLAAKHYTDNHGVQIINATRGGNLEVFERANLDELFEEIRKEKGLII